MRNSVLGFNQEDAIELGLTTDDLLILDYIIRANGTPNMHHIISDEVSYVWLSHQKIHEDLPILNITEGTLKNKLSRLKELGLIQSKQTADGPGRGSRTFYSVTMTCIDMTTSRQNDVVSRPRHAKMTSDNSISNTNSNTDILSKDNIYSTDGVCSEPKSDVSSKAYSKEDFLGSRKKVKPTRKLSLFDKCLQEIDSYTQALGLRDLLVTYLELRLSMKDKPIYGVSQWKGILNKLKELEKSGEDVMKVVGQSIEKGYASFYPVSSGKKYNKPQNKEVFSEYGEVSCERSGEEDRTDVEF